MTISYRRQLVVFLKIAIPVAIILWLLGRIQPDQLRGLWERPKDWNLLALALLTALASVVVSFVRWYLLIRALEIPFRLRDAFRLGFLGYLLNYVSVGSVGGDLFKAVFIAREQPKHRTEAVATVIVDRVVGLYGLLLLTSVIVLVWPPKEPDLAGVARMALVGSGTGAVAGFLLLFPPWSHDRIAKRLSRIPKLGPMLARLLLALRMYRSQRLAMGVVVLLSVCVHTLICLSVHFTAYGLYDAAPTLRQHFTIVPLTTVAASLPFTPAGLGALELAMDRLYAQVADGVTEFASGVTVALGYRLISVVIAGIGIIFYWFSRAEVEAAMAAASATVADDE